MKQWWWWWWYRVTKNFVAFDSVRSQQRNFQNADCHLAWARSLSLSRQGNADYKTQLKKRRARFPREGFFFFVFSSNLWGGWVGLADLAKFGYRSKKKLEKFRNEIPKVSNFSTKTIIFESSFRIKFHFSTSYDFQRNMLCFGGNYIIPQQLSCFKTHLREFHPLFMDVIMFQLL
jgi:hypothetical protein